MCSRNIVRLHGVKNQAVVQPFDGKIMKRIVPKEHLTKVRIMIDESKQHVYSFSDRFGVFIEENTKYFYIEGANDWGR